MTEFYTRGQLAQLVLRDTGHDGQPKLAVLVQRVDIVILEEYADTVAKKLARVLDRIKRVSGKAGDFFRNNKVKTVFLSIIYHAVEVLALLRRNAGQALVNVPRHKCPRLILTNQVFIVGNLVAKGIQLLVTLGRHARIVGHAQRQIVNLFCFELLLDGMDVHKKTSCCSLYHVLIIL